MHLLLLLLFAGPLLAGDSRVEALFRFLDETRTLRADFSQRTYRDGVLVEELKGEFLLKRPDRFRWSYREPYRQEIVADGSKLWIYDPDLFQVTVRQQEEALRGSPAQILSRGSSELRERFSVQEEGAWLRFLPREEGDFVRVEIYFDGVLREMRLLDRFGQRIEIAFSNLERNLPLPDRLFRFEPPPGVDLIEE